MRKARKALAPALFAAALVISFSLTSYAQNREKFVISARAGGVNAVTGGASMRPHGNSEWQQLTIKQDLEKGDIVRTGLDGRVEMLLNPGSYMRIGENSEFELADNSLENLEVRLIRGTAIVEVTGADDQELFIGITTPHTRLSIVRRGLYRLNVVPGDNTELIVRKGRVMLEDSHTKVKGGNKVVFTGGSFSVAKLQKTDKKSSDTLEGWSKDRAQTLAKANSKLTQREVSGYLASFNSRFGSLFTFGSRFGLWMYNPNMRCFTFLPFGYGWDSPYGPSYSSFFYAGPYFGGRHAGYGPVYGNGSGSGSTGSGSIGGSGSSGGSTYNPPSQPVQSHGKPEINNGPLRERRPEN
jgi:hypothetical protein